MASLYELDDSGNHETEAGKYGCIHDKCTSKSARRTLNCVSDREGESTDEDEALKDDSHQGVIESTDDGAENQEVEMLKEVDLTSLTVVHLEPVSIWELFAVVAISSVRVAEFRSLFMVREGGTMLSIELLHELSREHLDTSAHRECVDRKDVL